MSVLEIKECGFDSRGVMRVAITYLHANGSKTASADLAPVWTEDDWRLHRWYFEDFLTGRDGHVPRLANVALDRMADIGVNLFRQVFDGGEETRRLWAEVSQALRGLRVEIEEADPRTRLFPWELLRPERNAASVSLAVSSFVFRIAQSHISTKLGRPTLMRHGARRPVELDESRPYRVLFVICRPFDDSDVEYRAVARPVLAALEQRNHLGITLDLLRPPTFRRLCVVLKEAADSGRPYQIVHFDGHGTWEHLEGSSGFRGYALFEPELQGRSLVPGDKLGMALNAGSVKLLIMNACRSAYTQSSGALSARGIDGLPMAADAAMPVAYEVAANGVDSVIAMRYNVGVETAAQFVVQLYDGISQGGELADIFSDARRDLAFAHDQQPASECWQLPVLLQSKTVQFRTNESTVGRRRARSGKHRNMFSDGIPPAPEGGVIGQDYALLAIDRALVKYQAVMLVGPPYAGKSVLAQEFARWCSLTHHPGGHGAVAPFEKVIYREFVGALAAQDTLCDSICRALPIAVDDSFSITTATSRQLLKSTLLIVDCSVEVASSKVSGDKPGCSGGGKLGDLIRSLLDAGLRIVWVSRSPAQSLLPEKSTVAFSLRRLSPDASRALAGECLSRECVDDDRLLSLLVAASRGLPGVIRWIIDRARINATGTTQSFQQALDALLRGFVVNGIFDARQPNSVYEALCASIDRRYQAGERRDLALIALFQGFFQLVTLRNLKCGLDSLEVDAHANSQRHWDDLLQRAESDYLLQSWGSEAYAIHPFGRAILVRWFEEHFGEFARSALDETGMAVVGAYVKAAVELGDWLQSRADVGRAAAVHAFALEISNLVAAFDYALDLKDLESAVALLFAIKIQSQYAPTSNEWLGMFLRARTAIEAQLAKGSSLPPLSQAVWLELAIAASEGARESQRARAHYFSFCEQWMRSTMQDPASQRSPEAVQARFRYVHAVLSAEDMLARNGVAYLERTLREAADMAFAIDRPRLQAQALVSLAKLYYGGAPPDETWTGKLEEAEACLMRVLDQEGEVDVPTCAAAFFYLGCICVKRFYRSADEASETDEQSRLLECARENFLRSAAYNELPAAGIDDDLKSMLYDELGFVSRALGDVEGVERYFQKSMALARKIGDEHGAAVACRNLGAALTSFGSTYLARLYLLESRRSFVRLQREGDVQAAAEIVTCRKLYDHFFHEEMPDTGE
jgi:tetratricopeptide (TPR) repeat protein